MAMTNAERQARYRKNRQFAGENGERQLNTWLSTGAYLALARLAKHYGVTKREMLERLISDKHKKVTRNMTDEEFSNFLVTE